MSLYDAISTYVKGGMSVAFEGFTHLIPYAAAHETIRQKIGNLTVIRMTPDIIYDQMIGMGLVKKCVFSYAGNPGVGLLRCLRNSVENGIPHKIYIEEYSHASMANAYEAGAANLPFAVFRGYFGSGLPAQNPRIKSLTCPFTGETLSAVPSLRPDVSIIHAQTADTQGNVLVEGIIGIQKQAVLCATHSIVTVEHIVENLDTHPNACIIPHWAIDAICVVPGGAHPSYAHGIYTRDNAFYVEWDTISKSRETFLAWMETHVLQVDETIFNTRVENLR